MCTGKTMQRNKEKAIYKPRSEASEETNPTYTLIDHVFRCMLGTKGVQAQGEGVVRKQKDAKNFSPLGKGLQPGDAESVQL